MSELHRQASVGRLFYIHQFRVVGRDEELPGAV